MFSPIAEHAIMEPHQAKSIGGSTVIRARLMQWFVAILMRDARIAASFTQAEVAQALGYQSQTIYNWERAVGHPRPSEVAQIAETLHLGEEMKSYLKLILENRGARRFEADARLHALTLAKAEEHSGAIFKYEPHLIPGPLQTKDYHFLVLKVAENLTDFVAQQGWEFKHGRQLRLRGRKRPPKIRYLIGDSAIFDLRHLPVEARREQVRQLLEQNAVPGTEIKVLARFHPARITPFDIFAPGSSETAPPIFVYTETYHGSWCIEEDSVVTRYHEASQAMWQLGLPLKEFLNEYCRDLLA